MSQDLVNELNQFFTEVTTFKAVKEHIINALQEIVRIETDEEGTYHASDCYEVVWELNEVMNIIDKYVKK